MTKQQGKKLLISVGICVVFAIVGGVLTGDALENWFVEIKHPWFSLPFWGWYVVGVLYYLIAGTVLYRLFILKPSPERTIAIWLCIGMIAGNEFWNYLFFGLESTFAGFIGLIPFVLLVGALFITLRKLQRTTAWILFPYLLWLGYDLIWAYSLWSLNK